jgi:hypothetical protein
LALEFELTAPFGLELPLVALLLDAISGWSLAGIARLGLTGWVLGSKPLLAACPLDLAGGWLIVQISFCKMSDVDLSASW